MPTVFDYSVSTAGLTVTRASGGGRIKSDGIYEWDATHNTVRVDHDLSGTFRGVLAEPERTNYFAINNNPSFAGPDVQTIGSPPGQASVVANNAAGIDGATSAHTFTTDQAESRWWQTNFPFTFEHLVVSQYVKRNGDVADFAFGFYRNDGAFEAHVEKFATPETGFARFAVESPFPLGTYAASGSGAYGANRRDHPDGSGSGPASTIATAIQIEIIDGTSRGATSYIPTAGSAVTRAQEILTQSGIPNGRYHIRVVGDKTSVIWPDVEIRSGSWVIDTNPADFHVRRLELYDVATEFEIDGVPIIVKTIGKGAADFATLAAAKAAMPASLVVADQIWWLVLLPGKSVEAGATTISATTDARHPVWLSSATYGRATSNNRQLWWQTRDRTRLTKGTGTAVNVGTDYMAVWGLALDGLTMSAATAPGDPLGGFLLGRDNLMVRDGSDTGAVDQAENGGPYARLVNCHFDGPKFRGIVRPISRMTLAAIHCTAICAASKSGTASDDGMTGTLVNCIAVNFYDTDGLGGKVIDCATDANDGTPGLSNLSYGQVFENAYPHPELATGSPCLGAGQFRPEAQFDIRGEARPTIGGVDIGMVNKSSATDLTFAELVTLAKEGKPQTVNRNFASATFSFNPHWDGTGGLAASFNGGWRCYPVVPKPGAPMITGDAGGHGETTMDAALHCFNRNGDGMWERVAFDPEIQVRYKDDSLAPVRTNPATSGEPGWPDVAEDTHWIEEPGVPLEAHYYGGSSGNGAVSDDLSYMVMIGSSFFSSSGGSPNGDKLSIIDLATGLWDKAYSGANGEVHGGVANGGKAFVQVEPGKRIQWHISSQSRKVLKFDLTQPRGSGLQTGSGQDPGLWYTFGVSQTGLDGGACYVPGLDKAFAWQRSTETAGTAYAWIDVSGTNPVFTGFTPTGDLPEDADLNGATGVWHESDAAVYLYTGRRLFRFDPATEIFENVTPSQAGATLKPFPNLTYATGPAKAILGYLPSEDLLMMAGAGDDDVWLYNPVPQVSVTVSRAMLLGL